MSENNLQRQINFFTGIGIAVSMVIGSGLFGLPGLIIKITNPSMAIWGWLGAAIAILPLIYIFSYLGVRYPVADGVAKYAEVLVGKGGSYGASLIACGALAMGMPAFFLIIGGYIAALFKLPVETYSTFFAIGAIIFSTGFNLLGPERSGILNKLIVPTVTALIIGISIYYIFRNQPASQRLLHDVVSQPVHFSGLWVGAAIAFWAFQGWENLSFGLGEFKNPTVAIPRIYWASYVIILLVYLPFIWSVSVAAYSGFNINGISGLANLLGTGLIKNTLLFVVVLLLLTNSISWAFGVSRIVYATANKKLLPNVLAKLSNNKLPSNSLILCGIYYVITVLAIHFFNISPAKLFLLTTQGFIVLYGVSVLAFLKLSKGLLQKCIGLAGLVACALLLAGFSWMLIYSFALAVYGLLRYKFIIASAPDQLESLA